MKVYKILTASVISLCISANAAFAAVDLPFQLSRNSHYYVMEKERISERKKEQDPIKQLQHKKEKIQKLLDQGKLTKEEAQEKIKIIDAKIKKLEEFNKLSLKEKKKKLIKNFKTFTDDMVKKGKITQEKADELLKEYESKVKQWDGNGHPPKFGKGLKKPLNKK